MLPQMKNAFTKLNIAASSVGDSRGLTNRIFFALMDYLEYFA